MLDSSSPHTWLQQYNSVPAAWADTAGISNLFMVNLHLYPSHPPLQFRGKWSVKISAWFVNLFNKQIGVWDAFLGCLFHRFQGCLHETRTDVMIMVFWGHSQAPATYAQVGVCSSNITYNSYKIEREITFSHRGQTEVL